jgi:hypothetical protein
MLENKISELKDKVEKAKQDLLEVLNNEYSYASTVGEQASEFVVLLSQLEILEELEYGQEE